MVYFIGVPLLALLSWLIARGKGDVSPWNYVYCTLIYLACVPGIFSITISIYQFLFERSAIEDINIYTQILPIFSMLFTLYLVRENVSLDKVPGFGKLSGLMLIILILLALMWILDRTRIIAITGFPFYYVFIVLIIMFIGIRYALNKMATGPKEKPAK